MTSSSKKLSVLVVDDDKIIQRIHSMLCKNVGCEAQIAKDGKEAVDLFKAGNKFDLVLMDMEMPVMDGPTATKELREMEIDTIIVGISSRDEEFEKSAFIAAGLNDFRTKPLNADTLTDLIQLVNKQD